MVATIDEQQNRLLRAIPSVDAVLRDPLMSSLAFDVSHEVVRDWVRAAIESVRAEIIDGTVSDPSTELILTIRSKVEALATMAETPTLNPVINATGVIIHTNLGRAPLAPEAIEAIDRVTRGYSNLEYDVASGRRGRRETHTEELLKELLGCEAGLIVNNNAAAVMLVLDSLAEGGEVIVSRGELVEIGGAFRIPEIMTKTGARLKEVGTTNRTRISDYERAITDQTRLLLRVHQSNFRLIGFTEHPALEEIVDLGHKYGLPCFEDLGSGCLLDLTQFGIENEPTVQDSIRAGVDICSFSGDKLLGGPQAGVIVGRKDLVEKLSQNSLMRALRPDKLTYAALESTLRLYRIGQGRTRVPVFQMFGQSAQEIKQRATRLIRRARKIGLDHITFQLKPGFSVAGGGAAPSSHIDTVLITLKMNSLSASEMEARLRAFHPPIITRIEDDCVVLDLRTVSPQEEKLLLEGIRSSLAAGSDSPLS